VRRLAHWLRGLAERLDYAGTPKGTHWTFTFEPGVGVRWREDGRGCRVWYLNDAQYVLAHTQADGYQAEERA